jgi:hypothetical protein
VRIKTTGARQCRHDCRVDLVDLHEQPPIGKMRNQRTDPCVTALATVCTRGAANPSIKICERRVCKKARSGSTGIALFFVNCY